jgi:2-aminoadipate transaminase
MPRWEDRFAARTREEVGAGLGSILALSTATDFISFSGGFPDPATFPGPALAEILGSLIDAGDASAMQYAPTPGLPGPRAFIAARLERLEGRRPQEEELLITSGAIEALELLSKTFLDPGDLVLVEGPTYLGAIMAFRSFQADVECLPIDHDGLDPDALERHLAAGRVPKLLYTIPDHQNPAGLTLSAERRRVLVELSRRYGFLLVEDVAYRELGFAGARLPSLWSLAPDTVVQIGTFSKTFFPGVRLGWGAGPAKVVAKLVLAKQNTDQCAGALGQRLLEEYGRRGLLEEQNARAVSCRQHLELHHGDQPGRRLRDLDRSDGVVVTPDHQRRYGQPPQLVRLHPQRASEPEGRGARSKLGQVRGRGDRVIAFRDHRLDQIRVADDGVLLAHRRHQPDDHLGVRFHHARQQVADHGCGHHADGCRDTGAGQQRGRREQQEPTNALGAREGIPEGPGPTH